MPRKLLTQLQCLTLTATPGDVGHRPLSIRRGCLTASGMPEWRCLSLATERRSLQLNLIAYFQVACCDT